MVVVVVVVYTSDDDGSSDWAQYCTLHCVMGVVVVLFPKAEVQIYILNAYIVTRAMVMVVVVVECT